MKLLPSQIDAISPEVTKEECLLKEQTSQPRKRKIAPASLLTASFKMGMITASELPQKRARVCKEALVKESFSALVALQRAIDHVTDDDEEDSCELHNTFPDSCFSLSCRPSAKSVGITGSLDYLHDICMNHPNRKDRVEGALQLDPEAAERKSSSLVATGSYSLPINIALKNRANIEVLELLVDAAPSAIAIPDGYDDSASLNIAIRNRPEDLGVMKLLWVANPLAIAVSDSRGNYPIHVACACGAPLDVINVLYSLYPEACLKRNIHHETPLDIAQRNLKCEASLEFLRKVLK